MLIIHISYRDNFCFFPLFPPPIFVAILYRFNPIFFSNIITFHPQTTPDLLIAVIRLHFSNVVCTNVATLKGCPSFAGQMFIVVLLSSAQHNQHVLKNIQSNHLTAYTDRQYGS